MNPTQKPPDQLLTAGQAAAILRVRVPTLYAYVSRGLLTSQPGKTSRSCLYRRREVEALRRRREQVRDPTKAVRGALEWGTPVLDSAMTLIDGGTFFYRGREVAALVEELEFEEVAGLLWGCGPDTGRALFAAAVEPWEEAVDLAEAHPCDLLHWVLRRAAVRDPGAADLRPQRVRQSGAALLRQMVAAIAQLRAPFEGRLAAALQHGWAPHQPRAERLLHSALVASADHELNVSTFAARCVASAGAPPYEAVAAGLSALRGFRHGGHSDRVEALLSEVEAAGGAAASPMALRRRLQRGEEIPGFGQPLYPQGDPRYSLLMRVAGECITDSPALALALATARAGEALLGEKPTLDLALAAIARALGRPPGGAFSLFALGRTVGWIGHALEEYERGQLIRPRARYTGPPPR